MNEMDESNILNRSCSAPDVCQDYNDFTQTRKSVFQEVFQKGVNNSVFRYYSCEEIYSPSKSGKISKNLSFCSVYSNQKNTTMLESKSVSTPLPENALGDFTGKPTNVLKKRKNLVPVPKIEVVEVIEHMKENKEAIPKWIYIFNIILLLLTVAFLVSHFLLTDDIAVVQIQDLKNELNKKMYHQSNSIGIVIDTLSVMGESTSKILLVLVGSTGVGKTYMCNLIKKHFHPRLVHDDPMPLSKELSDKFIKRLDETYYNLVILDDLKINETESVRYFINLLPDSMKVVIVATLSIQTTDDEFTHQIHYERVDLLKSTFNIPNIRFSMSVFNELSINVIKSWLTNYLTESNVKTELHEAIMNNVLDQHDIKYNGLKGVQAKLLLELGRLTP